MNRIIKTIVLDYPFVTLEKIQSILLEHGSSTVPTDTEAKLSLKQAIWVYSEIEQILRENVNNKNKKKELEVNTSKKNKKKTVSPKSVPANKGNCVVLLNENSFKYLEDILPNLQQTDSNWRINNLKAQENLYFEFRCQYGLSISNTIELFQIGENKKVGVYDLETAVRSYLSVSGKETINDYVPMAQIAAKLKEIAKGNSRRRSKFSRFTPIPRKIDIQIVQDNNIDEKAEKEEQRGETIIRTHKRHASSNKQEQEIHETYLRKCSLGVTLPVHSFSGIQEIIKAADYKYCLTSEFMLHLYRHIEGNLVLKKYFVDNIIGAFIKKNILSKHKDAETSHDKILLSIFAKETESKESSFFILTSKKWQVLNRSARFQGGSGLIIYT